MYKSINLNMKGYHVQKSEYLNMRSPSCAKTGKFEHDKDGYVPQDPILDP